jgi:hypothetical protein
MADGESAWTLETSTELHRRTNTRCYKHNGATYYKEGAPVAHWQDQLCHNFVRRFISNLSGRIEPFMELVKIKSSDEFCWGAEQQRAFEVIKEYLSKPPMLVPLQQDKPFYIYLSVGDTSIASVMIQVHDGKERVVFYLSRKMLDVETRYTEIEKLCLCLFFTCTKLRHILLSVETIVICKSDVIKHMLSAPVLKG